MEDVKFQIGRADKFSDWAAVTFFLLGLALLNHALGPLTRQTNLAAAIALFALGVFILHPRRLASRHFLYFFIGLGIIIFISFLLKPVQFPAHTHAFFLSGAIVYLLGLRWCDQSNPGSALPAILLLTSFLDVEDLVSKKHRNLMMLTLSPCLTFRF